MGKLNHFFGEKIALIFLCCMCIFFHVIICFQSVHASPIHLISPENALQKQHAGGEVLLVDIRKPDNFSKCHINDSINVEPRYFLEKKFLKNKEIILVYGGVNYLTALSLAEKSLAQGFSLVSILDGGIARWADMGFPLQGLQENRMGLYSLPPAEIHQLNVKQSQNIMFVDLRNSSAFVRNSLSGAVSYPLSKENMGFEGDKLARFLVERNKKNKKQIILISQSSFSSRIIHDFREKYQFEGLFFLDGGMDSYVKYTSQMKAVLAGKKMLERAHQAECR